MVVYVKNGDKTQYLNGDLVPQVGNLFVDKLTMTLDVPEKDRAATIAGFQEAEKSGSGMWVKKAAYKYCLKLSGMDEADILIECSPATSKKTSTYRFFRIEFNPAKANLFNLKKNIDVILPGGYALLMEQGIVTRIDLTVDASYLDATDVVAINPKVKVECVFRPIPATVPTGKRPPFRRQSGHHSAGNPASVPEQSGQYLRV